MLRLAREHIAGGAHGGGQTDLFDWSDREAVVIKGHPEADAKGKRTILLSPNEANRLKALRRAGESYSDVILRLGGEDA